MLTGNDWQQCEWAPFSLEGPVLLLFSGSFRKIFFQEEREKGLHAITRIVASSLFLVWGTNITDFIFVLFVSFLFFLLGFKLFLGLVIVCKGYCQAQFQFSPVPVELRLALSLIITHPTPPGKVEMQLEIDHVWPVGNWWIVCLVIFSEGYQRYLALCLTLSVGKLVS